MLKLRIRTPPPPPLPITTTTITSTAAAAKQLYCGDTSLAVWFLTQFETSLSDE